MKTIKQQSEITFVAPTIKDAVIMATLMNKLLKFINNNEMLKEYKAIGDPAKQEEYLKAHPKFERYGASCSVSPEYAKQIYDILTQCGFVTTED